MSTFSPGPAAALAAVCSPPILSSAATLLGESVRLTLMRAVVPAWFTVAGATAPTPSTPARAAEILVRLASDRGSAEVTYTWVGLSAPAGNEASSCLVAMDEGASEGRRPDMPYSEFMNKAPTASTTSSPAGHEGHPPRMVGDLPRERLPDPALGRGLPLLGGPEHLGTDERQQRGDEGERGQQHQATDTMKAGAMVWNDFISDSTSATIAAMTTRPEEAMA